MRYGRHACRLLVGTVLLAAVTVLSGCCDGTDQAARMPDDQDMSDGAADSPADRDQLGGVVDPPTGSEPSPIALRPVPDVTSRHPAIAPGILSPQPVPPALLPLPDAMAAPRHVRPDPYDSRPAAGQNPLRIRSAPRRPFSAGAKPMAPLSIDADRPLLPIASGPEPMPRMARPEEAMSEAEPMEPFMMETASRDPSESADEPDEESASEEISASDSASDEESDYQVVTVFYGTDRNSTAVVDGPNREFLIWVYLALGGVAATMLLFGVASLFSRRRLLLSTATLTLLATMMLAIVSLITWLQGHRVIDGPKIAYGNQRGQLEMGTCEVSIPKHHEVGELESPSVFRFEFVEDPTRHVVLLGVEPEVPETFFAGLRDRVAQSPRKEAFVFVHGFNVTFEDAARRTAQLSYDLEFAGAAIFYSWPSQGGLLKYIVDETNAVWTVPHLKEFITSVARESGAESVHLIAHSLGNRALTSALGSISHEFRDEPPMFHEVVLTAPDIDAEVFRRDIAPAIVRTAERVTLYASSNDEALIFSKKIHGYPRAGDTGGDIVVIPGIETVDVSAVDTSLIGHAYYGDNDTVIADLMELVRNSKPPQERQWLETMHVGEMLYWIFRRDAPRVGSSPAPGSTSRTY